MKFPRSSGVLLHITSLPGAGGVGDLGHQAFRFVDFLASAGQSIWQILPLSPPAEGNSPYSAYSAFAGNPLMINLSRIKQSGLLRDTDLPPADQTSNDTVNFQLASEQKETTLKTAFDRFRQSTSHPLTAPFLRFCQAQSSWLDEFARFEAIMRHFKDADWSNWPADLVNRRSTALAHWDAKLADAIHFSKFKQFLFDDQWHELKRYANQRGVKICGDMPIFVAHESADVWANQKIFAVDERGKPTLIAGVPPDYFSETGQLWGNPQYRWDALQATDYRWWTQRFGSALRMFDLLRVDHFRGFEAYWEVPADAETAISGKWQPGPGTHPFDAAREALGELPFIAEDLGLITKEVHALREQLGFPGMRVLQFGFDHAEDDFHRPNTFPEDSVAYTGTHDNDTLVGWLAEREPAEDPDPLDEWIQGEDPIHWQLIEAVFKSKSDIAIVPMQDILGLDNHARMNIPGQAKGNWGWRMSESDIHDDLAARLRQITTEAARCPCNR